jgi:hypothetical protein
VARIGLQTFEACDFCQFGLSFVEGPEAFCIEL